MARRSHTKSAGQASVSWLELGQHTKQGDLWVAIHGNAYNVSDWAKQHPGGEKLLLLSGGRDATDAFDAYHPPRVAANSLQRFLVGPMETPERVELSEQARDFRALRQQLIDADMFSLKGNGRFYLGILVWLCFLLASAVTLVYLRLALPAALVLGVFWQQAAFVGHDAGHNSVLGTQHRDNVLGVFLSCFLGIGVSWWKDTHNVHHTVCNSAEQDPDIQHLPLLAPSKTFLKSFWSTFHNAPFKYDALARALVSIQNFTFFPLLSVAKFLLFGNSLVQLAKGHVYINRFAEAGAAIVFISWVLGLAFAFPTWTERVTFVVVSHLVAGVLHVQIALSHWPRPHFEGEPEEGEWLKMQVAGTMDWSCPPQLDWIHGGLQFQLEHHLFPRIPRRNLRSVKPFVIALCAKHGLDYHSPGFFTAVWELFQSVLMTAMEARAQPLDAHDKGGMLLPKPIKQLVNTV